MIAGSTRLKAGTVQKVILNMLSTAVFTRLAHTHRGRMVGVVASTEKQRARAAGVVADLGRGSRDEAVRALELSGGNVKVAIVILRRGLNADEARARLETAGGDLKVLLAEAPRR
jgi:N-acetylmuramic acid 6-phosphate etherase